MNLRNLPLVLIGAPWLGHGRRFEAFASLVGISFAIAYNCDTTSVLDSKATVALAWKGYENLPGIAFAIVATLSIYGLLANINIWPLSRQMRFLAGISNSFVYSWYVLTFIFLGAPFAMGAVFAFWTALFSIGTMTLALADLPKPGRPGAL